MTHSFFSAKSPVRTLHKPLRFVLLIGFVSLFADVTYEGARAINGPFLSFLGANAFVVSVVAGSGELLGYGIRLLSGYLSDRTRRYWTMTLIGYSINMIAVPLLALANQWPVAAALMVAERVGKAIRTPARDAMLARAGDGIGIGWAFALHEALDQVGAMTGPLIVAAVYVFRNSYQAGYAILLIPASMALLVLATARLLHHDASKLEPSTTPKGSAAFPVRFWWYLAGVALVAAGYADFPLIAYHWQRSGDFSPAWIPVLYSYAMGADALAALAAGRLYDRMGLRILLPFATISACFALFVFGRGLWAAFAGMTLWGIGMGAQESVLRAAVSNMVRHDKRATAFGVFNTGYGLAWFFGSAVLGLLYDRSLGGVMIFSVLASISALPFLWKAARMEEVA